MGWGSFVDGLGSGIEHLASGAEHLAGEGIHGITHGIADGLDAVGLHGAAQSEREFGDGVADMLGAHVAEMSLAESRDPKDLVHGDPAAIEKSAAELRKFQAAFQETYQGLSGLDGLEWEGKAAEAFRARYLDHPRQWAAAADACGEAAAALSAYASTVTWAQSRAKDAVEEYRKGQQATERAELDYEGKVYEYNQAVDAYNSALYSGKNPGAKPVKPVWSDPGTAQRNAAQQILDTARRQRDSSAETAATAIRKATGLAPAEPSFAARMKADVTDGLKAAQIDAVHFYGGVVKGAAGIIDTARSLNPEDVYNVTHPAAYLDGLSSTAAGLVHAANNPSVLLKSMVGSGWRGDFFQSAGQLVPNLALSAATDGAGGAAEAAAEDAARSAATDAAENAGEGGLRGVNTEVTQQAVHAGSMSPAEEQAFINKNFPGFHEINARAYNAGLPGHNVNCTNVVQAVDKYLDGMKIRASPMSGPGYVDGTAFGNPSARLGEVGSYDSIIKDMAARGEGARGVVGITRSGQMGHVFNVITTKDGVVFLDGQTGRLATLEQSGITGIQYMPYR